MLVTCYLLKLIRIRMKPIDSYVHQCHCRTPGATCFPQYHEHGRTAWSMQLLTSSLLKSSMARARLSTVNWKRLPLLNRILQLLSSVFWHKFRHRYNTKKTSSRELYCEQFCCSAVVILVWSLFSSLKHISYNLFPVISWGHWSDFGFVNNYRW